MKARIKRNSWGNWYGYIGNYKVAAFSEDVAFLVSGNNPFPQDGIEAPSSAIEWLESANKLKFRWAEDHIRISNPKTGHWFYADPSDEQFEDIIKKCIENFEAYWEITIGQHIEA